MAEPTHNHVPVCRAVNFDADTGAYTGTRASDPERCPTCAAEQHTSSPPPSIPTEGATP